MIAQEYQNHRTHRIGLPVIIINNKTTEYFDALDMIIGLDSNSYHLTKLWTIVTSIIWYRVYLMNLPVKHRTSPIDKILAIGFDRCLHYAEKEIRTKKLLWNQLIVSIDLSSVLISITFSYFEFEVIFTFFYFNCLRSFQINLNCDVLLLHCTISYSSK